MRQVFGSVIVLLFLAMSAAVSAQTLETAPSNNGSGGVFLDLAPIGPALIVHAFDVPLAPESGVLVDVEVWVRPGSYVGFTGDSTGWTLTQTIQIESLGTDVRVPLVLTTPIDLPAGVITGIYLHAVFPQATGNGLRYSGNSTVPAQTTWANADLTLFSDVARTGFVPFGGSAFTPRTFSGVIHYLPTNDLIFRNGFDG